MHYLLYEELLREAKQRRESLALVIRERLKQAQDSTKAQKRAS